MTRKNIVEISAIGDAICRMADYAIERSLIAEYKKGLAHTYYPEVCVYHVDSSCTDEVKVWIYDTLASTCMFTQVLDNGDVRFQFAHTAAKNNFREKILNLMFEYIESNKIKKVD